MLQKPISAENRPWASKRSQALSLVGFIVIILTFVLISTNQEVSNNSIKEGRQLINEELISRKLYEAGLAVAAKPSTKPSAKPSKKPSKKPSIMPTQKPSTKPTRKPSMIPTRPSKQPTKNPSTKPSSRMPTSKPSKLPTKKPSSKPTQVPTLQPVKTNIQILSCSDWDTCSDCATSCQCEQGSVDCFQYQWGQIISVTQNPLCLGVCSEYIWSGSNAPTVVPTQNPVTNVDNHILSCSDWDTCSDCDSNCQCEQGSVDCFQYQWGQIISARENPLCLGICSEYIWPGSNAPTKSPTLAPVVPVSTLTSCDDPIVCGDCESYCYCEVNSIECSAWNTNVQVKSLDICIGTCSR
eukprot:gene4817-9608_t